MSVTRSTIDFGIDLGTTNSAIAVLKGVSTEIIKNNDDQDVTPSAVSYGRDGQLFVGRRAKNRMIAKPEDAYVEFKRQMGTERAYHFQESGLTKSPEELSAEILKSLKADVSRALDEDIQAAVITVPAAFELHQCSATRKAAELAGLKGSPLVQEPVAAALAYGFQLDSERAYWLVYDFGGGTFDAALIKAEEGLINVVHHGGDNFLGGSDIDWAILERIVVPKLIENYDLPEFKRENKRWRSELLKLKSSVELAKIELTTKEATTLADCRFKDDSGTDVDCEEVTVTRKEVVKVAEPIIRRSIEICHKVLREKNLTASGVQKVILVGGPTKASYFREIIKEGLGIPVDHSVDPLTVVARGAAVFSGTQKIERRLLRGAQAGEFQIDLKYKAVGHEIDPIVGGKVLGSPENSVEGFTIELVNDKTRWRSGKIALRADGAFVANLLAEKGERNVFSIQLLNPIGTILKTVPDHLIYTVGAVVEEQPLINSMGVALANNKVVWFFKKGAGLPLKHRCPTTFRTTRSIRGGEEGMAIRIPVIEGENEAADRNHIVGFFEVLSSEIKRDLAAGSEVELTLKINESRIVAANIYVPILDEDFERTLDLKKKPALAEEIKLEGDRVFKRLESLRAKADEAKDPVVAEELERLRSSELVREIEESVSAAKCDADAAEKAEKRLLELKVQLDDAENLVKWPTLLAEVREWLGYLDRVVTQHGTDKQQRRARELHKEVDDLIAEKKPDRLARKLQQIQEFYWEIVVSLPGFWVNQFQNLEKQRLRMTDQARAGRLFDMGRNYLDQNNVDGLKNVVRQLWDLLPIEIVEEVKRGFGSTLIG
jgi:molecular chaperone DnaK